MEIVHPDKVDPRLLGICQEVKAKMAADHRHGRLDACVDSVFSEIEKSEEGK